MTNFELNGVADLFLNVYTARGFVLISEIQSKLDEYGASLLETNCLIRLLEERGCKISEDGDKDDDLSLYDGSYELYPHEYLTSFVDFYKKDAKAKIPGLAYDLEDFEEGLLFYAYLRLIMGLSKQASSQVIVTLQETYNMYLPIGEDKSVFSIRSASYIQTVMDAIHNRKVYKKIRAVHKNALGTYQMFLTQNKHKVISGCEAKFHCKV